MRFGFREIREIKREERNLHKRNFDPDKRIDPDKLVEQVQTLADKTWDEYTKYAESYDPDKRIVVS